MQRERKTWTAEKLTDLGMERAAHWGWTNTYTYTKSIGDQLCAMAATGKKMAAHRFRIAIVRPAIVESAMQYPFPGWNEGLQHHGAAGLYGAARAYADPGAQGHRPRSHPGRHGGLGADRRLRCDAALGKRARLSPGQQRLEPFRMPRSVELTGLYRRQHFRRKAETTSGPDALLHRLRSRMESIPGQQRALSSRQPASSARLRRERQSLDRRHAREVLGSAAPDRTLPRGPNSGSTTPRS